MPSKATRDVATLADRFGALAGEDYVDIEPAVTIHDLRPFLEVCPADERQLSEVLKLADRDGVGACITGGGTKMGWGNRPSRFDMLVRSLRLRGFSHIDADNLTLSAWAGTTVSEVRAQARALDRTLPLDPRRPSAATVGGVVASGDQGARGAGYGSVRDVVLGLKAVLADGSQLKLGGRTMKNVTGYDLTKLFVGSFGVLGVITEVTFRLLPRPTKQALMILPLVSLGQCKELVARILGSRLQPIVLEVLSAWQAGVFAVRSDGVVADSVGELRSHCGPFLLAAFAGHPAVVARSLNDVGDWCDVAAQVVLEDDQAESAFETLADVPSVPRGSGTCVELRGAAPLSEVWGVVDAAVSSAASTGLSLDYRISAARGTIEFQLCAPGDSGSGAESSPRSTADLLGSLVSRLRERGAASGGYLAVVGGLTSLPPQVDAWGDPGSAVGVMKRIKARFDPHATLNAGRFVGGI